MRVVVLENHMGSCVWQMGGHEKVVLTVFLDTHTHGKVSWPQEQGLNQSELATRARAKSK